MKNISLVFFTALLCFVFAGSSSAKGKKQKAKKESQESARSSGVSEGYFVETNWGDMAHLIVKIGKFDEDFLPTFNEETLKICRGKKLNY